MNGLTLLCRVVVILIVVLSVTATPASDDLIATFPPDSESGVSELGAPSFIQEPDELYFIVKTKPATITCKAINAAQINFKCVGQWVRPAHHVNVESVDPHTQQRYLQTSIDIMREEVDEYFGSDGYWCECHAWNNLPQLNVPRSTKSRRAGVQVAYLRKQFEREPLSTAVELEAPVQLQCLPPVGLPPPEVFWLKDNEVIDVYKEINFIISNEGNLILSQARLTDMGNYTCGAQNLASRRLSESALLTVYVNGGWSSWNHWSDCSVYCGKGFQRRARACSNPAPTSGGSPCQGDQQQRAPCTNVCPVDGSWSTWSSWSTCNPDCKQHRRRLCDSPSPENNGRYCDGSDLNTSNCTSGLCRDANSPEESYDTSLASSGSNDNIAMYAGLSVAIGFFIAVIIIIIILLRRQKTWPPNPEDKKFPKIEQEVKVQPDITRTVVTDHKCSPRFKLPESTTDNIINANRMLCGGGGGSSSTLPKKSVASYLLPKDSSECLAPRSRSACSESGVNRQSADSTYQQLPGIVDSDSIAWARISHAGGRIILPDSGVSMLVPQGAVRKGCTEDMFLAVLREDKDRPKLAETQTMLGPVVVCGPQGVVLDKPVIITFQHCASVKHGQWMLSIYSCDTPYNEPSYWQLLSTVGQETINTQVYVQVDVGHCHIMTESLMRYTLIGEPNMSGKAIKVLRVAVFAPAVPTSLDYSLRVYFVEDTTDAIEGVVQVEKRIGGRLLEKPKQILFQFGGANLCLAIEELGPGWRCKLPANYQEIPFWHIWSGSQNGFHCSVTLEHVDRLQTTLACDIHVFQKALLANRQVLQISCNIKESVHASPARLSTHRLGYHHNSMITASGVELSQPQDVFRLPVHIKLQLCAVLDPPNTRGNDWRMLAQRLGVDRYINYFATKSSPTDAILDLWEARHREESAITDLMNSLRVMGRIDAAVIIEKQLSVGPWL